MPTAARTVGQRLASATARALDATSSPQVRIRETPATDARAMTASRS
jgi:hypothetical protein